MMHTFAVEAQYMYQDSMVLAHVVYFAEPDKTKGQ